MEGAIFGGKLAAEVVAKKAKGMALPSPKEIQPEAIAAARIFEPMEPLGVKGEGAIAFGGGASLTTENENLLREVDPLQFA